MLVDSRCSGGGGKGVYLNITGGVKDFVVFVVVHAEYTVTTMKIDSHGSALPVEGPRRSSNRKLEYYSPGFSTKTSGKTDWTLCLQQSVQSLLSLLYISPYSSFLLQPFQQVSESHDEVSTFFLLVFTGFCLLYTALDRRKKDL